MASGEDIKRYTSEELRALRERQGSLTNLDKVDSISQEELERLIAEDPDQRDIEWDWTKARLVLPRAKQSVHLRLDPDIIDFFRAGGKGHITRMQAVLRAYVDAHRS